VLIRIVPELDELDRKPPLELDEELEREPPLNELPPPGRAIAAGSSTTVAETLANATPRVKRRTRGARPNHPQR
jgi:hypothetical protein